ncbi:MAG: N-6 DNA methylase [Bacteroidetes bacterium]|nr:N-6 DNA methylase [Bacteroidota bacterium]
MTYEQIHNLFKQRYNQNNWKQFLGEAFAKSRLLATPETLTGIDSNVASQVQKLGYITLNENGIERQIAVYEVTLAQGIILERNRVGLRNLLRKYWKDIDAAFIAYHRPETPKWRFTYVSELTGYDADGEFVKIKTEPKRYTYVLGEGESTRTAAERFTAIANKGSKATLDDVKEAFSVEKLSKAFFDEYKKHYDIFCDFMVSKPNIRQAIFNGDEKGIRDFNKKLLGRIVFLYFIQKKGWLGVPAKSDWGKGDFDFLTNLFKNTKNPDLFYSELLSKLFFDTLNTKRKDDLIELVKGELCRIPYLNGGLFEEDDKKHRNLIFPANLFKSLFDFFNQYNFTIYEDDPNDHTVAVDPEMLGHIFENLLEDNKDKGAYYTPKEIVHYMCQESLIEYLTTWFENKGYEVVGYIGFDKPDQPKLFSANEGRKGQLVMETDNKTTGKQIDRILIEKLLKKKLNDDDKKLIKKHSAEFHNALDSVKICDPAIGSGAFPMGLLHEIFTAKQTLHTFEHGNTKSFDASGVKLNIIQNSIYGVDIEKGAVDIARLRFWLSLIVDEEKPKALPNLDYKIVVGNSLVSKLGDDIIDIDWTLNETSHGLFGADLAKQKGDLLKKISKEQKEFFNPDSDKKKLAADIRKLKIDLLITQLELMISTKGIETKPNGTSKKLAEQTELYLQTIGWKNSIKDLQKLKNKPELPLHFFDWKLDFPEVMNEQVTTNVGFDIVIGNPPYGANIDDLIEYFELNFPKTTKGFKDIYKIFYNQGIEKLTKKKGVLTYITPNTFLLQPRYKDLRQFFLESRIISILNLGENVFDEVTVPTAIIVIKNDPIFDKLRFADISKGSKYTGDISSIQFIEVSQSIYNETQSNIFTDSARLKAENEEQLVSIMNFKDAGINYQRVNVGLSDKGNSDLSERLLYEGKKEKESHIEYWKGTDISSFYIAPTTNRFVRPNIRLRENERAILNSDYFNIKPKLIWRQTASTPIAAIDRKGIWFGRSIQAGIIKPEYSKHISYEYLCCLLNSKYIRNIYEKSVQEGGRVFPQVKLEKLKPLPIKLISMEAQKPFIEICKKIEKLKSKNENADITEFEKDINVRVYKLYELTYEEVKVIDPAFSLSKKEYEAIKLE